MTDDLERRLREAFEAKATSITPSMMDVDREREFADELDATGHGPRRWMVGGLSAAAAVAAAIGIGVVVSNQHPPTREPVVAASSHQSSTPATDFGQPATPTSTPPRHPEAQSVVPPHTTQAPPPTTQRSDTSTPAPPRSTTEAPKMSPQSSTPTLSTSEPTPSSADGNYYLRGDLKIAAGTAYLPLPASVPTYIQSETGRTTRLSTGDCAGVAAYWQKVMPSQGWTKDSALKWSAPSGNAWAFLSNASGTCTIQISAGP